MKPINFGRKSKAQPRIGSTVRLGNYDWRVLDIEGDRMLVLSERVIEKREYNEESVDVTWEGCTLRGYLNDVFLNTFSLEEQDRILPMSNQNKDNLWYDVKGGNVTDDRIFLLSMEELDGYFGDSGDYVNMRRKKYVGGKHRYIPDENGSGLSNKYDKDRMAKDMNGEASWWWSRSPGSLNSRAIGVNDDGHIYVIGLSVVLALGGVRPAMWVRV